METVLKLFIIGVYVIHEALKLGERGGNNAIDDLVARIGIWWCI